MRRESLFSVLLLSATAILLIFYFLYFREFVMLEYQGTAPEWFHRITHILYPRFEVEKYRLPVTFFLKKTDQVFVRISLLSILVLFFLLMNRRPGFSSGIQKISTQKTTPENITGLRVIFYFILLIATRNIYEDLIALHALKVFYQPVLLFKVLHLGFPEKYAAFLIYGAIFFSSIMVIFSIKPVFFSLTAVIGFILYQGFLYSFEKIDHGYGPFTYALLLFPFLLIEYRQAKRQHMINIESWALQLIRIVTVLAYFLAGIEKVLISGIEWGKPETLQTFLLTHPTEAGLRVATHPLLCSFLAFNTLFFELGFPLILFYQKLKWVFLPAGVLFHFGTVFLLGISSYENPWLFNYIFFFNWSGSGRLVAKLPGYFRS